MEDLKELKISDLILKLIGIQREHGNLPVYYASDYDWVVPLSCLEVRDESVPKEQSNWEGSPKEKVLYLE